LKRLGARSLLDAACGAFGWVASCVEGLDYIGADIVPAIITENLARAQGGAFEGQFFTADINQSALPKTDVVLCRDGLVHLSFSNIEKALARFRESGAEWLLATTFSAWEHNADCEDGDWRALNLQKPPFCWPAPIEFLNESCAEGDGAWRAKCLGLWRIRTLA
jgi:hypothetical protein